MRPKQEHIALVSFVSDVIDSVESEIFGFPFKNTWVS